MVFDKHKVEGAHAKGNVQLPETPHNEHTAMVAERLPIDTNVQGPYIGSDKGIEAFRCE